ncbi:MAG TPA: galactosylceramidase, partial [Candidatus Paceibacterota bacterium]|nr:galactosylceramidase [Candidatus Paceibacterota bacterium]
DCTDRNFHRGYEWWLMKEARKRNPLIYLDCLQWGAPGWIGNGDFYSQDNADYLIEFLKGARDVHGLNIQFAGVWNETRYDTGWIKLFRKTLDRQGFTNVQLVAADEITRWSIVDVMKTDPELAAAVDVIGTHYPKFKSTLAARQSGKPIWCSEDGPWKGDWDGARELARMYNRNYVDGQMSKTIIWSPVTSYYDILPLPGSGVMRANEPWSGHFETQPALWATAHTTQFAEPGWIYLGGYACGYLPEGGSFVALKSPKNGDYSVIVETSDATGPQTLRFVVEGGLATGAVHLWRSQAEDQFVQLPDVRLTQGSYSVTFEPDSIYSLTTTTGQTKGNPASPPSKPFPMNYSDTFEDYEVGVTPRYFSDQAGAFEIAPRSGGGGKCLRQVVRRKGIEWHLHQDPFPETIMGDANWRDYEVSVDVFLETEGFISLFGRIGKIVQKPVLPEGYWLKLSSTGYWELGTPAVALMSGKSAFKTQEWHNLKLQFTGATLRVFLDGQLLGSIVDRTFAAGMIGLGSGWHAAEFDNLKIK